MGSDLKTVAAENTTRSEEDKKTSKEPDIQHTPHEQYVGGTYSSETISKLRKDPQAIGKLFKEGKYPYTDRIPRYTYEEEKARLQIELLKVQNWVKMTGQKIVVIFEGRDAAGKGGTIKRRGEVLFLDRSWYNRAGVERVMGFCDSTEYLEFMRQCPEFERMLVNSDIKLFKYYFSVTKKEQRTRFASRQQDPLKQWKMSPVDKASVGLWHEYTRAKEAMFFYTVS